MGQQTSDIGEQIVETWRIHNRIMLFMIRSIPDDALKVTLSRRGGRDIARQLAHVHMVRVWRLEPFAKKVAVKLISFAKEESPGKKKLLEAFEQSGGVMEKYVAQSLQDGDTVSNFRRGVVPMIGYYISHEAHHRGNILLTIKQSGFRLPDALKWGIWEWNKL